jgi:hypothetical protein
MYGKITKTHIRVRSSCVSQVQGMLSCGSAQDDRE